VVHETFAICRCSKSSETLIKRLTLIIEEREVQSRSSVRSSRRNADDVIAWLLRHTSKTLNVNGHPFIVATLFQPELSALSGTKHTLVAALVQTAAAVAAPFEV
jgi:CTP synthase (UTP-ammonia lyase)